jgi:hypothetical protein
MILRDSVRRVYKAVLERLWMNEVQIEVGVLFVITTWSFRLLE